MAKEYDVIVIGAGNGGLAAAAFTAKNGLKTLIVDTHNIPGGSATSFVRGRFEFETSLHELAGIGPDDNPGPVRKVFDLLGADVDWTTFMETFHLVVPCEGVDANMPAGAENFCMAMEAQVPGSGQITGQVLKMAAQSMDAMNDMMAAPGFDSTSLDEKYPDFTRMAGHTISEALDALGMPKKAQDILSTYWCYLGAPSNEMDFFTYARMLLAYVTFGAGQPMLRSHEISLALDKVIRDNGGDIWYNTPVQKILVEDGKACGVMIGDEEYRAKQVISNAYPNVVWGSMVDPEDVPKKAAQLTNSRELGLSFVTVYLGMNRTAEELGVPAYSNFLYPCLDSVRQKEDSTNTHGYTGLAIMNCLNLVIPNCTPEGTCQLFFTTAYFGHGWDDVKPEEYEKIKEDVAEQMIRDCEKAFGMDIMPYIEEIEIAAPPTFARYLRTPQGTPYGYQMNDWDRFIERMYSHWDEQYMEGLHFVGAATPRGDGYSSAYLSGIDAGKAVVRAERSKKEVQR